MIGQYGSPYYHPLARYLEFTIGIVLARLCLEFPAANDVVGTILEVLAILLLGYPFFPSSFLEALFTVQGAHTAVNAFLICSFASGKGILSKTVFRNNRIVEWLNRHSFDVYIFHFTVFHFLSLSPSLASPGVLLAGGFVFPVILGALINRIVKTVIKRKTCPEGR